MKFVYLASSLAVVCNGANIVELAKATPQLSTLVQAVVAADLVDTLSSPGTFTVFAPTNDAFAALPAGVLDDLLKPENKAALSDILLYHVLSSEFKFADANGKIEIGNGYSGNIHLAGFYDTALGKPLRISTPKNFSNPFQTPNGVVGPLGGEQTISTANNVADNGVVHIINGVMMPSLIESGRIIDLTSSKEKVEVQEGACYHREFNGTSGTGVTGNDQRAFCIQDYRLLSVVALQYSSTDGSCQNPRITDPNHIGVFFQGANSFLSGATVLEYNEQIRFDCPAGAAALVV